ncbi:hypothetical protein Tco_0574482, partial [Tanacetum coccineum]
ALTNEDIRNSESYKEYYAMASGTIPPKTKGSKKKANTDTITKQKPPTAPKEKKSGKGKQKTTELETISEADLTEAEQLKIITKRSRQETHSSHASGSGADEGTGVTPGVPDAPDYDSEDDISWKSSDDDQDDEQAQDDEDADKNDVNETTQDDEDDDDHDDDEKVQDDDDEEQTESEDDGDDFVHPKLTTHDDDIIHEEETDEDDSFNPTIHTPSRISSSDDEDSDNEVEGANVEGAKSDEDATYGDDATDGSDHGNRQSTDSNTDLLMEEMIKLMTGVEVNHVTYYGYLMVNNRVQSVSLDSVSNLAEPQIKILVLMIFFDNRTEATSLIDTHVTAIVEPSFTRPPTPHPILFGFVIRLKALEDTFSEFRQTNQYADALSSIPGTVDQYLANKMQEAVNGSQHTHAVAANLSELELKRILIDKMEANNSINRSDIQKQLYKALVEAYEADQILLDTYGDTVTIKRPRDGADDDEEPSAGTDRGSKRRRSGKEPASTGDAMHSTDVSERPADQEFETGVQDATSREGCSTSF